jgi:hypothetical protein
VASLTRSEEKALALHRAIAAKLRDDPSLLAVVRHRLGWLRTRNPAGAVYYDRWARALDGRTEALLALMESTSSDACALRQESPFVDLVDQKERAAIYRAVAHTLDARTLGEAVLPGRTSP